MKHKLRLVLFVFPALLLSSCGFGLDNVFKGDIFNSAVFSRNYYSSWDKKLSSFKGQAGTELESHQLFRNYSDFLKTGLDEQAAMWDYFYIPSMDEGTNKYSNYRKMNNADQSFKYGYLSKLYDGQMFCGGDYQLSRVQVNSEGFAQYFHKEGKGATYFAANFKASIDFTNTELLEAVRQEEPSVFPYSGSYAHESTLDLTVSIYAYVDNKIAKFDYINSLNHLKTNHSESWTGNEYEFFGFALDNLPSDSRIVGFSMNYTADDPVVNVAKNKLGRDLDYSLMLYEVMIPFATWN